MNNVLRAVGDLTAKRPLLSILVVVLISMMALSAIAINGLNNNFSTESFMPENEAAQASDEIAKTFTGSFGVTMLGKGAGGDVITKEAFLEVLRTEKAMFSDERLSPYWISPNNPSTSIVSPVDIIATVMLQTVNPTAPPTYDALIAVVEASDTPTLKATTYGIMASPMTPDYVKTYIPRLFTSDFDPSSAEVSAKGMLIMANFDKAVLDGTEGVNELTVEEAMVSNIQDGNGVELSVMGNQLIANEINDSMNQSLGVLFPIALAAIVAILLFIYRDVVDMVTGLVGLMVAILWTYGFGAAAGFPFNPMTMIVPILILGLGIDYGIHMTMRYREERSRDLSSAESSRNTAVSVGSALLLATVTTMVAFLSNLTSSMETLVQFGILNAVGILSSFVVMLLLVPSVKVLRDRRAERKGKHMKQYDPHHNSRFSLERVMAFGSVAALKRPMAVIVLAVVVTAGFGIGATQIQTAFDMNDFLPNDTQSARDLNFMMSEFNVTGEASSQILVKGDITDPAILRSLEETIKNMGSTPAVLMNGHGADAQSILSVFHDYGTDSSGPGYQDPRYNATFEAMYLQAFERTDNWAVLKENATQPQVQMLVGWLYQNAPQDMVQILALDDEHGYATLVTVKNVNTMDSKTVWALYDGLKEDVTPLTATGATAVVTGGTILTEVIMSSINESQISSLMITAVASLAILVAIMWFTRRSFALGAIAVLPIMFCVIWTWGTMFLLGIDLNVLTLTIASLTVGMGITYGIHITHRFVEDLDRCKDVNEAVRNSVGKTGASLLGAALTTVVGFGIISFASLPPVQQFGMLTAMAIGFSFISSTLILPSLLVVWARRSRLKKCDEPEVQA